MVKESVKDQLKKPFMGYSTPEKNDMLKEGAKEKEKLQEKRRARSKR